MTVPPASRTSAPPTPTQASGRAGGEYVASLHGGNIDLRELVDREGEEYVRENLVFAFLEFWSNANSDEFVFEREAYWKRVLMSREYGHN